MKISQRLKGGMQAQPQDKPRHADACPACGEINSYIPVSIGVRTDDGVCHEVCCKITCIYCGHLRRLMNGKEDYCAYVAGNITRDPLNFWAPREAVVEAVFDKAGVPVFDADGKQLFRYSEKMKLDFVKKIISLVAKKERRRRYFTLEEVMAVKLPE